MNPARAGMIRESAEMMGYGHGEPRASGDDPSGWNTATDWISVNPARAGMIRPRGTSTTASGREPRASGDDPLTRRSGRPRPA